MTKFRVIKFGKRFKVQYYNESEHEWRNSERGFCVYSSLEEAKNYIQEVIDAKNPQVILEIAG